MPQEPRAARGWLARLRRRGSESPEPETEAATTQPDPAEILPPDPDASSPPDAASGDPEAAAEVAGAGDTPADPGGSPSAEPADAPEPPPEILLTRTSLEQRARDHLDAVVEALAAAGVDCWYVPNPLRPARTRLGTFAAGPEVLAALAPLGSMWTFETWDAGTRTWQPAESQWAPESGGALRAFTTVWDPGHFRRIGAVAAVEVDCWWRADDQLVATLNHVRGTTLPADDPRTPPTSVRGQQLWTWRSLTVTEPTELIEPVDAVITWVDSADPVYAQARSHLLATPVEPVETSDAPGAEAAPTPTDSADGGEPQTSTADELAHAEARTRSLDELRYTLRSLDMFAPWLRRVWLLTDLQRPEWLDDSTVTVVDHRDVLGDTVELPTFNSHAIETALHRIDGLAEHFLYFNDDTMLGMRAQPGDFFSPTGHPVFQPSGEFLPAGPAGPDEAAPGVAGRTMRELLEADFGRTVTHKLRHTPHPLTRSLMSEVADRYPEHWARTAANRFRSPDDIPPISMALWYALLTGRASTASPTYTYVELSEVTESAELEELAGRLRRSAFFCLNLRSDPVLPWDELAAMTGSLLDSLFPFTSRFER